MKKEEIKQTVEKLLDKRIIDWNYRDGKLRIRPTMIVSNEKMSVKPYKLNFKNPNLIKVNLIFEDLRRNEKLITSPKNLLDPKYKSKFIYDFFGKLKTLNSKIQKLNLPKQMEIPNYVSKDSYDAYLEFKNFLKDNRENHKKYKTEDLSEKLNKDYKNNESEFEYLDLLNRDRYIEYMVPLLKRVETFCKEVCVNYYKEDDTNLEEELAAEVKRYVMEISNRLSLWYSSYFDGKCNFEVSEEKIDEFVNNATKEYREMFIVQDKELNVYLGVYHGQIFDLLPKIEIEIENKCPSYYKIRESLETFKFDYTLIDMQLTSSIRFKTGNNKTISTMLFYNNLGILKNNVDEFMNKVGVTKPNNKAYSRFLDIIKENEEKIRIINSIPRIQKADSIVNAIKDLGYEENLFDNSYNFIEINSLMNSLDKYFKKLAKNNLNEDVDGLFENIEKTFIETVTNFIYEMQDYLKFYI